MVELLQSCLKNNALVIKMKIKTFHSLQVLNNNHGSKTVTLAQAVIADLNLALRVAGLLLVPDRHGEDLQTPIHLARLLAHGDPVLDNLGRR